MFLFLFAVAPLAAFLDPAAGESTNVVGVAGTFFTRCKERIITECSIQPMVALHATDVSSLCPSGRPSYYFPLQKSRMGTGNPETSRERNMSPRFRQPSRSVALLSDA